MHIDGTVSRCCVVQARTTSMSITNYMYMSLSSRTSPCYSTMMTDYHGPKIQPVIIAILQDPNGSWSTHDSRSPSIPKLIESCISSRLTPHERLVHLPTSSSPQSLCPASNATNSPLCLGAPLRSPNRCQAVFTTAQTQSNTN
jgi:hypothetical protein